MMKTIEQLDTPNIHSLLAGWSFDVKLTTQYIFFSQHITYSLSVLLIIISFVEPLSSFWPIPTNSAL